MGDFLNNANMQLLEKKLDAVWMRQQVISNNIANAETPGYKSKSLEFESILDRQLSVTGSSDSSIQGALDPLLLRAGGDALDRRVDQLMEAWGQGPWIFNLGHGILPDVPIAHVEQVLRRIGAQ